ncbi:hypothetical protein [Pseudogulbenkiania subflava]|uniref:Uncharacterized protein n=1 Tax=Pseudogulbenkiania subflava DSM 22618 TaxID=1123014 RepID=A0A1Y6CG29_9NEIS|nr:hypothetical protein [Pseudogulbenkiania subflava]SMF53330.1 hypothetical protein SAMN02745746_03809 [Pseudogulbenkiania subflava DSM 22618]
MDKLFSGSLKELADFQQLLAEAAALHYFLQKPAVAEALANPCEIGTTEIELVILDRILLVRLEWHPGGVSISLSEKKDG